VSSETPSQPSDAAERRLANLRPFPKGVSGNPGGRTKGLQRRVRELVGDDGDKIASFLFDVLNDTSEKTGERLDAAKILLERGWGKAPIAVDVDGAPAKFVLVSAFAVQRQGDEN
jgi:hypothetical protein